MRIRFPRLSSIDSDITKFKLFIEELEHAGDLLQSKRLAKERMALVILDSMAERLLYEHAELFFDATEQMAWRNDRQYTARERNGILGDFASKVVLAQQVKGFPYRGALLNDLDGAIFRVAHTYRNAGYHRGDHNDVLTGPLARLYARAIARALARSAGDWIRGGFDDSLVADLDRFDWRDPNEGKGQFSPKPAAERIGAQITAPLVVDAADLAKRLVADFEARCDAAQELLDSPRVDGLDDDGIKRMLEAALHWARHRGDERLLALKEEQHELIDEFSKEHGLTKERRERLRENEREQFRRIEELEQVTEVKFDLGSTDRLRRLAACLEGVRGIAALLQRYQELDGELRLLEAAVLRMSVEWDRYVEHQMDIARGK
jgi:hypothetical protein